MSSRLAIDTTPWVIESLERLAESGRYPPNREAVAEELVRAALRLIEKDGIDLDPKAARRVRTPAGEQEAARASAAPATPNCERKE